MYLVYKDVITLKAEQQQNRITKAFTRDITDVLPS